MSLKDSKDAIEQLFGDVILKNFPNYELFWKEFIGNPNAKTIGPYKYIFPPNMVNSKKNRILNIYEKIQMFHYSLFCHLAGAHFHLNELMNAQKISNLELKYFRHWEHYEVGYMHLGSALYMMESLWNLVLKLRGHQRGHGRFGKLKDYLNSKRQNLLLSRLDDIELIEIRRDLPVHRGRVFTLHHKGKFYVPLKVDRNMMWSQSTRNVDWVEAAVQLDEDISKTEKVINDLHTHLINEYRGFISSEGIQIEYE